MILPGTNTDSFPIYEHGFYSQCVRSKYIVAYGVTYEKYIVGF